MKKSYRVIMVLIASAIVSGALAYKSRITGVSIFVKRIPNGGCNSILDGLYTTTTTVIYPQYTFAYTVNSATSCPIIGRLIQVE